MVPEERVGVAADPRKSAQKCAKVHILNHRDRKKGSLRKGSFHWGNLYRISSKISKISKFSRISRKRSESPFFSTVWGFPRNSRISKFSRISRKDPYFQTRNHKCGFAHFLALFRELAEAPHFSQNDKRSGNQGFKKSAEIGHGLSAPLSDCTKTQ